LRVLPRSRVFRYKGNEADPEKIGRELNVQTVLTGRVVQRDERLNIQTELVDVAADSQLWGRQYNRKFSDIITVQDEIAKDVSQKLGLRPTGEEEKRLTSFCRKTTKTGTIAGENDIRQIQILARGFRPAQEML